MGEDEPGAGVAGRHRLPRAGRADGAARRARVQPRRLRLHDLHRQLGPAARRGGGRDRARRPQGGRGALGQPQLRGPHPPGGARQLPGLAAARRRLRAGRQRQHRPHDRPARRGRRRPRVPARRVAERGRGGARPWRARSAPTSSTRSTAASSTATSAGRRCPCPRASCSPGIRTRPTCARRPSSSTTPTSPTSSDARVLAVLGDSVTTDHISPAGAFSPDTPAGKYLVAQGVAPRDFNSYGARRGNHEVMVRGTFANIRLRNALRRPRGRLHPPSAVGRADDDLRRRATLRRGGRAADRRSPAASTARAARATGRPRGRRCWACGR